jgi:hypothetical protein
MSKQYSHSCQTLSSMSSVTFSMSLLMHLCNSGSGGGVNIVLGETPKEEKTLSCLVTGVAMLTVADAWPIHRPGRFPLRYSRTPICQCGGVPSYWKMNTSSSASYGINQFCNIFRYICPVTLFSVKKNRLNTRLLETAQNTFTLGLLHSISSTATGFSDPHIQIFCLLTFPEMESRFVTKSDPFWQTLISFHHTQDFVTKRQSLGGIIRLQFLNQLQFVRV